MKKLLLFICVLAVSAGAWAQTTVTSKWDLVTSAPTSWEGEYIIVAKPDANTIAIMNGAQTVSFGTNSGGLNNVSFSEEGGVLTIQTEKVPSFILSASKDPEAVGTYTILGIGGKQLGVNAKGDNFTLDKSNWSISFQNGNDYVTMVPDNLSRELLFRASTYNVFKPYALGTSGSGYYHIYLYKQHVKTNASGFATYCNSYNVTITGAEAYKAAVDGETITLTSIGTNIPANTGVILYGAHDTSVNVVPAASTPSAVVGNDLKASSVDVEDGYVAWVLNGNQFLEYTGAVLAPNKAYIPRLAASPANALRLVFDNESTGIQSVQQNAQNGVAYNLAGQRVSANAKGIVVVNGKKYINK